jgi:nucleotide-binding universal stress UspA family protein
MTLYRRILVPLDGSAVDDAVLEHVIRLAEAFHSEVILLRVAHFHTRDTMTHEVEDAQAVLDRVRPRLEGRGFAVRAVVGRGEPAEDTVEQAEALDCDLIAMGTHGHGALKRVVLGSFAEKVRHATDVPLLLVKAKSMGDEPADERKAEAANEPADERKAGGGAPTDDRKAGGGEPAAGT